MHVGTNNNHTNNNVYLYLHIDRRHTLPITLQIPGFLELRYPQPLILLPSCASTLEFCISGSASLFDTLQKIVHCQKRLVQRGRRKIARCVDECETNMINGEK